MKKTASKKRIPAFRTKAEARRFWETHDLADYWDDLKPAPEAYFERPRRQVVTLRLDRPILHRLQKIALKKGLPYSTLIRMWIVENCAKAQ